MADPIKLVAIERGFVDGCMVEPGTKFMFDPVDRNGKERKLPKWAAPVGDPRLNVKKPENGDLKPKAAQLAVKAKAGALTGSTPV